MYCRRRLHNRKCVCACVCVRQSVSWQHNKKIRGVWKGRALQSSSRSHETEIWRTSLFPWLQQGFKGRSQNGNKDATLQTHSSGWCELKNREEKGERQTTEDTHRHTCTEIFTHRNEVTHTHTHTHRDNRTPNTTHQIDRCERWGRTQDVFVWVLEDEDGETRTAAEEQWEEAFSSRTVSLISNYQTSTL